MPETHRAITPHCVACGSDAVIPDVFLFDGRSTVNGLTNRFGVGLHTDPGAMLRKKPATSRATYRVCGDCGFAMLFADDPQTLWDGHVERLSRELGP